MTSAKAIIASALHSGKPTIVGLMKLCDITGAQLAERVDVYPSTVSHWVTGKTEPPGAVYAYLELLAKVRAIAN